MAKKFDIADFLDTEDERELLLHVAKELDEENENLGVYKERALRAIARSKDLKRK